jgi:transcriptional regulator with XRE-family HTH domain
MNPPFHNLGQRLQMLRKQWFKSQQAYANHCHKLGVPITPTVIADWENSRSEIPARFVPFLAHTLNAQVNDLLPSFTAAEIFVLPALLPPPKPDKPVKPASAVRTDFATRQLALDSVLRNFDRKPCRFAHVSSERDRNNPFENLVWHDNRTLLMALLRALDRNHRQVILWYYYGGLTRRQIAAKLNRSVELVSLRIHQGRATLRRLLNSDAGRHWLRREFREQFAPLDRQAGKDLQAEAEANWPGENTL